MAKLWRWAAPGLGHYLCAVIRSLRALLLFWTLFASYGFTWLRASVSSAEQASRLFERAHRKNARRLTPLKLELGGKAFDVTVYDGRLASQVEITLIESPGLFESGQRACTPAALPRGERL